MVKEDKQSCVFCEIFAKKSPVSMTYEDDRVMVFPPLKPVNIGHLLVVPKEHFACLSEIDEELFAHISKVAKKIAKTITRSKFKNEGINLFLADGEAAGQEVFHLHLHVYPRYFGDDFGFKFDSKKHFVEMSRTALDEVAKEIKSNL